MVYCEGCGWDFPEDQMQVVKTKVNLHNGTQRSIRFDGQICCDIWDDTEPGDWVSLASGEEVQLIDWRCSICDSICPWEIVTFLYDVDTEYRELVCSFCCKKHKDQFVEVV